METVSGDTPEVTGDTTAIKQRPATPETRYADLHRMLSQGADDEKTWADLTKVCLDLDKNEEAVKCYHKLVSFGPRSRLHALLVEKGLLDKDDAPPELPAKCVTDDDMQPTVSEGLSDAMMFLVSGRVPVEAIVSMVAFGVLLAIGGILQKLTGVIAVNIVTLPIAVALYGVLAALTARILMESVRGMDDPPELPTPQETITEAKRGALFLLVPATMLLLPGLLAHWLLGVDVVTIILLMLGWAMVPLAFSIRYLTKGWGEAGPATWWKVLRCTHPHLLLVTAANLLLFAPASLAIWAAIDQPAYLVACFAGLLSVVSMFASARMMGQALYYQRKSLTGLLEFESSAKKK